MRQEKIRQEHKLYINSSRRKKNRENAKYFLVKQLITVFPLYQPTTVKRFRCSHLWCQSFSLSIAIHVNLHLRIAFNT